MVIHQPQFHSDISAKKFYGLQRKFDSHIVTGLISEWGFKPLIDFNIAFYVESDISRLAFGTSDMKDRITNIHWRDFGGIKAGDGSLFASNDVQVFLADLDNRQTNLFLKVSLSSSNFNPAFVVFDSIFRYYEKNKWLFLDCEKRRLFGFMREDREIDDLLHSLDLALERIAQHQLSFRAFQDLKNSLKRIQAVESIIQVYRSKPYVLDIVDNDLEDLKNKYTEQLFHVISQLNVPPYHELLELMAPKL